MYEKETYDVILQRMLDRVPEKMDKRESSLIWDTHSATAIELQILYLELEQILKNMYGDTADREHLVLLCKDRQIIPCPATKAILRGVFSPGEINVTGKRFNIGDMNYVVLDAISPGQYRVECETAGSIGNQYLGKMIPMDYIPGLESALLSEVIIPGEEEEETEHLRQRYFDAFRKQAFGGNREDYLTKAKSLSGVGGVKIKRIWNDDIRPADMIPSQGVIDWYAEYIGIANTEVSAWLSTVFRAAQKGKLTVGGTILITVSNNLNFGKVNDILLKQLQTEIDPTQNAGEGYGIAPIGHVVTVQSVEEVSVTISSDVSFGEGYNLGNSESEIQKAISDYLLELRKTWQDDESTVVRISQIEARILNVPGVIDINNTSINGSQGNLTLNEYEVPMMGEVVIA